VRVSPSRLLAHLRRIVVDYDLADGWADPRNDPYHGRSDFAGVLLHHTAGLNAEKWVTAQSAGYPYKPYRACHFLVERSGGILVVSGTGAYHAGQGGPWTFPKGPTIPRDSGNSRLYGIEIESLGTSPHIDADPRGMTAKQIASTALLTAALLEAIHPVPRQAHDVTRVIRHRDWTSRKIDTQQDLGWWRQAVRIARTNRRDPALARALVTKFARQYPTGRFPY
jgi:N-acetyl-anhydromuramyl-L-alanine amidase AmpD